MNINIGAESEETQQQNVSFADQNQQWVYSIDNRMDPIHKTVDSNSADLGNFFARPIKVASINWPVGSTFGTTINPWQLYFNNLRVVNRISNYNVLRSRLCVRIMINGNGFHYGRALASYRPLHNEDDMVAWRYGLVPEDIIGASQRMHVWIDPTKSQGGTLCLPYVNYTNAMNIPEVDWANMGELDIASITTLEHANGGTDSVTLSVFAWAEDVSLSVPTLTEPGTIAPQSQLEEQADESDKASVGPISGPAAAVANVAASLKSIPTIGKFAAATEMAAKATGATARLFGMSRPVDTGPIHSYKPMYAGNLANTDVLDTSLKLTYDVKQGVTIDPIAVGLGPDDEMAISSIAARESYLTQFLWPTTSVPESMLWTCRVTPMMFATSSPSGFREHHLTPMAYVALPFKHWRGPIKYRFQVVASAFHKGRLKFVYEPYSTLGSGSEYNVQETHIMDLAKERDLTIEVAWGQEISYVENWPLTRTSAAVAYKAGSGFSAPRHEDTNGILSVHVVNDLTTPSADVSAVSVLVSVSAGDGFEVINPRNSLDEVSFWQPQSALALEEQADLSVPDADDTTGDAAPVGDLVEKSFGVSKEDGLVDRIFFGDPVISIRQLLKRYQFYRSHCVQDTDVTSIFNLPDFPMYRGYASGLSAAVDNAASPADPTGYNYTETTMMNWFTPLFLARRGAVRHKFIWTSATTPTNNGMLSVIRVPDSIGYQRFDRPLTSAVSRSSGVYASSFRGIPGHNGVSTTPINQNPTLEVEIPYHTNLRFNPARRKNHNTTSNFGTFHQLTYPNTSTAGDASVLDYVAAAEDYSLAFFQACPVFWFNATPSPSATA